MGKGLDALLMHLEGIEGDRPYRNGTDSPNGSCTATDPQPAEYFSDTCQGRTDKTDKTHPLGTQAPKGATTKNSKTTNGYEEPTDRQTLEDLSADPEEEQAETSAERRGLTASWPARKHEHLKGYIELHDPLSGERHHIRKEAAPNWAKTEASKRAQMYRSGVTNAYLLTSREMEEMWQHERTSDLFEQKQDAAVIDKGIVYEDYLEGEE